ncbi:MAG: apolipoprotein N-acyltransferase [Puniceicoccales bacterium]|jgi:apolipoprotein N-acyltransferase|nr:apolipoprotein N-acyltransferase [Puniceicoccales bacterium]
MLFFGNTYRALRALPWAVGAVSALLYAAAMPGVDVAECAWLWAVPFALWALDRPSWKSWLLAAGGAVWVAKVATLIWLRHIYPPLGWLGLFFLTGAAAVFPVAWLALLRWMFPKTVGASVTARLVIQLGLAGAWVVLEWVQSWVLTGFPWMLLADTQWQRPAVLALCSWGGPWALSFAVILFNVGLARYVCRFFVDREGAGLPAAAPGVLGVLRGICPEFYLGVLPIFFAFVSFMQGFSFFHSRAERLFTVGVVQTDFDPNAKWDERLVNENFNVARELTLAAARLPASGAVYDWRARTGAGDASVPSRVGAPPPDFILWPEAALPFPMEMEAYRRELVRLVEETGATLVIGAVSHEGDAAGYYNGIHVVSAGGVADEFYAKRHLVPFGEYVPLGGVLPLRRVVPIAQDCRVGQSKEPLWVQARGKALRAGALVCYEDVFSDLSLDMARRGADFLVVLTNDAWYGREAGAYQHAAHSAVAAASLRLPVVRCGNNGWSGVFNPLGQGQALVDGTGSIYFRGAGRFDVWGVPSVLREPTFYVRHGNWVVTMSVLLLLWALVRNRRWKGRRRVKEK